MSLKLQNEYWEKISDGSTAVDFNSHALTGVTGGFSFGGSLTLTTAVSKIVPGATSLSLRNTADSADNLIITDAGAATFRGAVAMSGALSGVTTLTATTGTFTGAITSSSASAGIGYATGAGGAVTQITSRTTGVTLSKTTGTITTDTSSLAAEAAAEFTVTNTAVAIGDVVVVSIQSGTNGGNTSVIVSTVAAGSFKLKVCNDNAAGGTAETGAIIINFAVIKAVSA